jgi:2'-5' RNA ligase
VSEAAPRLFVAIPVGPEVQADARAVAAALGARLAGASRALRWVRPEQVHLTLRFLGNVDAAVVPRLRAAFLAGTAPPAFSMTVGGLGWLPGSSRPRVLMRSIDRGSEALLHVQSEIDALLRRVVTVPADDRAFRPHVTLARVREGLHGALRQLRLDEGNLAPAREVTVGEVTLYSSRLSPAGPSYDALEQLVLERGPS